MRTARIAPGRRAPRSLVGSVLTRDLVVGRARWSKGRRLSADDLDALVEAALPTDDAVTVLVLEPGDVHEDDAGRRLAAAIAGPTIDIREPVQSRVDLRAAADGVLHVDVAGVERLNRLDALEVFTALDGSVVGAGALVASVKVAPHVVPEGLLATVEGRRGGPLVRVAPFVPRRVGVVVKESIRAADRERFERSVRAKVESLGSTITGIAYVADAGEPVAAAVGAATRGPERADILLTAGGRSTDPLDPFFAAIEALGGTVVRHGVPAHPGSMLWLARIGRTAVLGLPTCGAYSKATAADLVLPRLLTGERPTARLVSGLGHGGILTRDMRFRFPPYARSLDAPDG